MKLTVLICKWNVGSDDPASFRGVQPAYFQSAKDVCLRKGVFKLDVQETHRLTSPTCKDEIYTASILSIKSTYMVTNP